MTVIERLQNEGLRRVGSKTRGFRWVHPDGKAATFDEVARIRELRPPPGWSQVYVSPSERSAVQAVGKDVAGRWQYRYSKRHTEQATQKKYARLLAFANRLPALRRRVAADLAQPGLGRDKVLATMVRVLSSAFMRPGSQVYADENGSFGLTTLRARHVKVKGDTVIFDFEGKSGQHQYRELKDRQVAHVVRALLKVPGRDVFKFVDEQGKVVDVRRRHLNAYIKDAMGAAFSAKDFRTWAGTLLCASTLARTGADPHASKKERKRRMTAAVKETAEHLGNTPAVCRSSYIFPAVLRGYEAGRVVERYFEGLDDLVHHHKASLHAAEKALLALVEAAKTSKPKRGATRRRRPQASLPRGPLPEEFLKFAPQSARRQHRPAGATLH